MTENEAKTLLISIKEDNSWGGSITEVFKMAIQALEEIQQYRAIGKVEEITKLIKFLSFDDDTSILEDLQMLTEYYAIGTIDEFKALKEKSVAKKPIDISRVRDCEGYIGLIGKCPCCGEILEDDSVYCDCGQKLDWSE